MPTRDELRTWPTRQEAAAQLGVSVATVDRWIAAGRIRTRQRPRQGARPAVVCQPDDVLAALQQPDAPAETTALTPPAPPPAPPQPDPIHLFAAIAAQLMRARPAEPAQYLTLQEAAAATGLSVGYLRRRIRAGDLPAIRDRETKIRRDHLNRL